jgi:hypothetical protein
MTNRVLRPSLIFPACLLALAGIGTAQQQSPPPFATPTIPAGALPQGSGAPQTQSGTAMAAPVWTEDFDTQAPAGWELLDGASIFDDALVISGSGHGFWLPVQVSSLSMTTTLQIGAGNANIVLAGTDNSSYVIEIVSTDSMIALLRFDQSGEQSLGSSHPEVLMDTPHELTVNMAGGRIEVIFDGQSQILATDPNPLPGGTIGLGGADNAEVLYEQVRVTSPELPAANPPV